MKRLFPVIGVFSCLIAAHSFAGSATWSANPTSGDWNTAANWTPNSVPNGPLDRATFNGSNTTAVSLSADTEVDSILFDLGASAFTVTVPSTLTLNFSGSGLLNNSNTMQNFVTEGTATNEQGTIQFSQNASAGSLISITNEGGFGGGGGGLTSFTGSATAQSVTIINNGSSINTALGGRTEFSGESTAGIGTFINNGGAVFGGVGGRTDFFDNATAAEGSFIVNGGTALAADGGVMDFLGNSTAGNGTFTVNSASATGASSGLVVFYDTASAGEATFTLHDGALLSFDASAPTGGAGNATLIANGGPNGGATIVIRGASTGGTARVQIFQNATLDISLHDPTGVTIGSLEGDGQVLLGRRQLSVGSNNLGTTFAGVIGNAGSLRKVGSGTLTLSGANIYTSGTTIEAGTLLVKNTTGSATGSGVVQVSGGTLGGKGIISGAVTLGTGSVTGGTLRPGKGASTPTTLILRNTLTFKDDGTYSWKLNTKKAKSDQVVANGVTIESGAQFDLNTVGNKKLTTGTVFTAISNTTTTPISGTFANLADGSTVTLGRNKLQVSYSGGDGNDLTLTVVP